MNQHETIDALKLRLELTGETYRQTTVASWTDALSATPIEQITTAITELARLSRPVTVASIEEWLRDQRAAERRERDINQHDGTGAPRFAVMDPTAVEARRDWWRNGRQGHWPGCPCDTCNTRRTWNGDSA